MIRSRCGGALVALTILLLPSSFGRAQTAILEGAADEWVRVAPLDFQMGCVPADRECGDNERPRHRVRTSRAFWIMTTEVTAAAFRAYARAIGRPAPPQPEWSADAHPVVDVTWDDAHAYCGWIGGRLPTEAEWEGAARAGQDGTIFPWGDIYEKGRANDSDDFRRPTTMPVGSFAATRAGLYDVAGNVWEWVEDWYAADYYQRSADVDPQGPASGDSRVARGGGWRPFPRLMRLSNRGHYAPATYNHYVGFRCVRVDAPAPRGAAAPVSAFRSAFPPWRPAGTGARSGAADPGNSSR